MNNEEQLQQLLERSLEASDVLVKKIFMFKKHNISIDRLILDAAEVVKINRNIRLDLGISGNLSVKTHSSQNSK